MEVRGLIIPCSSPYKVKYLALQDQKQPKLKISEEKKKHYFVDKTFQGAPVASSGTAVKIKMLIRLMETEIALQLGLVNL